MTPVDYVILAIIAVNGLTSLMRGFIAEVMSLVVWAIAVWVSASFAGLVASTFLSSIEQSTIRLATSYISLFLLVLMLGGLVTWFIRRLIAKSGHTSTDRMFGFFFGLSRGLLMIFALVLLAGFTALPKERWWHDSSLIPYLSMGARAVSLYLPNGVRQYLHYPDVRTAPAEAADTETTSAAPLQAERTDAANQKSAPVNGVQKK